MSERPTSGRRPKEQFEKQIGVVPIAPHGDPMHLQKVLMFKDTVQAIGVSVGGQAIDGIRELGQRVIAFHSAKTEEEREERRREYGKTMERLGEIAKQKPKVGDAIVKITLLEVELF